MAARESTWPCATPLWPPTTWCRCTRGKDPAEIDAATRRVAEERLPEIVAIQEHQQKQTRTFLGSERFSARLAMRLLPFLANTGLLRRLLGKRLHSFQHGIVSVRLTA